MLHRQILLGTIVTILVVIFHVVCLVGLHYLIQWLHSPNVFGNSDFATMGILSIVVLTIIGIHTTEAWLWALIYLKLGEFDDLKSALYFSVVTGTALGYGDIVLSKKWQILSTFEAMGGLLLFGTSTAFLIGVMGALFTV